MKTYTIRVDYEVYELLRKDAEGFTDSPNDVIRRKLGMKPKDERERELRAIENQKGKKS